MAKCNVVVDINFRFNVVVTYIMIKLRLPGSWYITVSAPRFVKL